MDRTPGEHVDETRTSARGLRPAISPRAIRVVVVTGSDAGATASLSQRTAIIGRSTAADVRLTDGAVSSFHVELTVTDDGLRIADLNSRNGTWHGGVRLLTALVPSGATLELGGTLLRVETAEEFQPDALAVESFGELRGSTAVMRELFAALTKLARTDLNLLIEGPTGTGKELAARAVHGAGPRANGPFLVLDCGAIPSGLAESVLFGHERGAFTGAHEARAGIFEAADGGTVLLDEVGELPLEVQPKLLRVLERREITRVGSTQTRPVRVRVLSATWRDLRAMINEARFREDLYYRIAQARIAMPALRERTDDVAMLVAHFLRGRPSDAPGAFGIAPDALADLCDREYPGNVRELRSVVERAAATAEGTVITTADLAFERMLSGEVRRVRPEAPTTTIPPGADDSNEDLKPFKEAKRSVIDEFERAYLQRLLSRAGNKLVRAAQLAGLERHSMRDLFRRHGLSYRDGSSGSGE